MRNVSFAVVAVILGLLVGACKSTHEEGVKSNIHSQWLVVAADTKTTTAAAQSVLASEGLKDVKSESTGVDGKATGKKADGTVITATIKKKTDTSSELTVTVGSMGEPSLGASIAKKIQEAAEKR